MYLKNKEFAEAYNLYYPIVFSVVYSKISSYEDAEDICQVIFIEFYKKFEAIENKKKWLFGALIYYRLRDQFFIRTGPGIEILKHEEFDPSCGCTHVKSQTEFLYRIGLGYSYHRKNLIITPTIDLDFVRSASALVFGLNIGLAF